MTYPATTIEPRLPGDLADVDDVQFLVGAKILRIGTARHAGQEALAIEYQSQEGARQAVLLRFSELGIWIVRRIRG